MNAPAKSPAPTEPKTPPASTPEAIPVAPIEIRPAPFKPLEAGRLRLVRSSECDICNLWAAVLPAGAPFENVLRPDYWSSCLGAKPLRVADTIEVHVDDQTYFGRVLVRDVSGAGGTKTRASMALLELHRFDRVARNEEALTHRVEFRGPHLKHCVIQLKDGKVVSDGHADVASAEAALRAIVRTPSREAAK
jgi:hypothetical protein